MMDAYPLTSGIAMKEHGWICPKCGRVYAPRQPECTPCNKDKKP